MPREKKNSKKVIVKETGYPPIREESKKRFWKNILLIGLLIIGVLLWKFKGQFIAAMVNGQPISRWQLNEQLQKKFGDQTLDGLISEKLILSAAKQKGILISSGEIDGRMKQIEERLKGKISLNDALKAQGLTKDDLRQQLEIQMSIEKLFDKEATVSTKDVDDYISNNKEAYKNATDPAVVRNEAENIIRQQKISDLFEQWFADIRKNAKIQKF
ncbi:SurA N-terminal domain-containing protein [Candidatus Gottesmanbacteria bacterium]|nr:SurA N-terminal domain-containing protein [Candidatus Gottesmanbacteria bacterium]